MRKLTISVTSRSLAMGCRLSFFARRSTASVTFDGSADQSNLSGGVALGLFRHGQQPGLHHARHLALVHRHGGADLHHMLGLAVLAGDDGGLGAGDGKAVEAGDLDRARLVIAQRRTALLRDRTGRETEDRGPVLLRNGQRLRLQRGDEAQLVVADGELLARALAHAEEGTAAGLVVGQHQALLELGRVDGVREAHLEERTPHVGLDRVLVELGADELRGELGRGELVLALRQFDVRREGAVGDLHLVRLADGPVLRGQEFEAVLLRPGPAAGDGGLHGDAGGFLADARNGRDGGREIDDEGVWAPVELDLRALRRIGLRGGDHGFDSVGREAVPPLHHMGMGDPACQHQQRKQHQPRKPLLQPLQAQEKECTQDAQPPRGSPGTDEPAGQRTQEAERAAQPGEEHVADRREFSVGDLKHGGSPLFLLAPASVRAICEAIALCVKSS
ncbi:hypothetical protein [Variovorax sp. UC74_104]|uniref:hypothetical protein n=1 Tax=Variovorax sp. UC74_104 TaxID=3374555 RepID=UPI003757A09F